MSDMYVVVGLHRVVKGIVGLGESLQSLQYLETCLRGAFGDLGISRGL